MFKQKRAARYWILRRKHFIHDEAREFSKLNKAYPALKVMAKQRNAMWASFSRHAQQLGWGKGKVLKEWRLYIRQGYIDREWMVTKNVHGKELKKPRPNVWAWYDSVIKDLPPYDQWDTPRAHRKKQAPKDIDFSKINRQKYINGLNRAIRDARNYPARQEELREQKRRLMRR